MDLTFAPRKGQFYSLIAILIAIPVMLYLTFTMVETQNMRYDTMEKIVADQLHAVEESLEEDFQKAMEISGKRAFLAATDHVIKTGEPLDDSAARLEELVTQGTIYGDTSFVMINNTMQDWVDKILSLDLGFVVDIAYSDVEFLPGDGFNAELSTKLNINVSDRLGIGRISKGMQKEVSIPLDSLEDTVFTLNTLGFVSRPIMPYGYPYHAIKMATGTAGIGSCTGNVTFDPLDPDPSQKILVTHDATGIFGFAGVIGELGNLPASTCYIVGASGAVQAINATVNWSGYRTIYIDRDSLGAWSLPVADAVQGGLYSSFDSGGGPGIFKRLEGDLSSSSNGLETFVNLPELQSKGLEVKVNQVSVAYLYFSDLTINGQQVRGLPSWFRADASIAARYNLTELV